MPRIVIVTYNWPPRNAIGTHRPYAWAKYWAELGARVTVVTARKQSFDLPLDLDLPKVPDGVELIEIPYRSVSLLSLLLLKFNSLRVLARSLNRKIPSKISSAKDPRINWKNAANEIVLNLAQRTDIVVSTYGPAAAHLIASDMKSANPAIFWVADYRDLWSQSHTKKLAESDKAKELKIEEESVGKHANLLTSVSQDLSDRLSLFFKKPAFVSENGFDLSVEELYSNFKHIRFKLEKPLRIVYTGTVYDGTQDPLPLINSLTQLLASKAIRPGDVTLDFYGERVGFVRDLASDAVYGKFIRLFGHVSRKRALEAQRQAGLLLLLESPAQDARGVLTGKLFEYLVSGRPILCIGSRPEFAIGEVLKRTGTGKVFGPDEYSQLADFICRTLAGEGIYESYSPKLDEIAKFSRRSLSIAMYSKMIGLWNEQQIRKGSLRPSVRQ
jgi:glycosyltransferase involved in cell wall biosynthesis